MKDKLTLEKVKKNFLVRSLVFTGRLLLAAGVAVFLIQALPKAWFWGQMKIVRMEDISTIDQVMQEKIERKESEKLQKWLLYRPREDAQQILDHVPAYTSELPSMAFFELAKRAKYLGRQEDYVFWYFFGQYRMRYDLLRCQSPDSFNFIAEVTQMFTRETFADIRTDNVKMSAVLQDVLDFDAKHPARNDPRSICDALNTMQSKSQRPVPESEWARMRHTLRIVTEEGIAKMGQPEVQENK